MKTYIENVDKAIGEVLESIEKLDIARDELHSAMMVENTEMECDDFHQHDEKLVAKDSYVYSRSEAMSILEDALNQLQKIKYEMESQRYVFKTLKLYPTKVFDRCVKEKTTNPDNILPYHASGLQIKREFDTYINALKNGNTEVLKDFE